MEGIMTKVWS